MTSVIASARRRMYRHRRPTRVASLLDRGTALLASAGLAPARLVTLEVRGRRSGRLLAFPVVVADLGGERYLVAMLGESSNWVRNVRAAGGDVTLRHGRREEVHLDEVPPDARAAILRRYVQLAPGARAHIPAAPDAPLAEYEPLASRYPVFHVRAGAQDARRSRSPVRIA